MVHILEKPFTPGSQFKTLCGRELKGAYHIFSMDLDKHFYRCKICMKNYEESHV